MMSRAERTPLTDWWWTVDRGLLAALFALMVAGLVFLMGGGPPVAERIGLPTFYFLNRQAMYLAPTIALICAVSFLSLRGIRRVALITWICGVALCLLAREVRPRDQGRAPLDPVRAVRPAAVRIRQAGLRGGGRLGVLGRRATPRHAGRHPGAAAAADHHRAAAAAARFRPDHADHHGVVRAVLRGRPAPDLGRGARRARARRRVRRLPVLPPRPRALQQVPRPGFRRRLPGLLVRGKPSARAAGSAPARGRAWPSASCPTPIPTSSSR